MNQEETTWPLQKGKKVKIREEQYERKRGRERDNGLRGVKALTVIDLSHTPIRVKRAGCDVWMGDFEG